MKVRHLTDEDIQNFLDGNSTIGDTDAYTHLETCARCRRLLESYQILYKELGKEPAFRLSHAFVNGIVDKIKSKKTDLADSLTTEIILIIGGIVAALGATILFVDLKPILEGTGNIGFPQLGLKTSLLDPIKNLFSGIDGGLSLAPFAVLALASFALFDRWLHKQRERRIP